jgi:hemolysin D
MKFIRAIVNMSHRTNRFDDDERAFLPAALEIVETPASPIGRMLAYAIMALFFLAAAWACIGRVDIVATAKGKIVPSGRTKVIQPLETGVVREIHVHDGQVVKTGDVVIELDPTMNDAEWKHYESDLVAAQLDVARLQAELSDGDPRTNFTPPASAPPHLVAVQNKFLLDQTAEQRAKLAVLDRQREQKLAERETIAASIGKLEASLPVLEERLNIRKILYEHTTGSKANYLELLQPFVEEQHDLEVQKRKYDEATAALAGIVEQRAQTDAEYRRERYGELVEAERKATGLGEDVIKARHRAAMQALKAPIDGTVQQLAVHTIGGVVTPAQTLLVIVPIESPIEIEAMVDNRDIGFVHTGQDAEIKIDAFNFSRYGLVHGTVESISPDAIARDKPPDKAGGAQKDRAQDESSEPANQELVYAARVSLARTQMEVEDRLVDLSPGMAVTVEIKTGSRRIITYLLSPLLRYKKEALRER